MNNDEKRHRSQQWDAAAPRKNPVQEWWEDHRSKSERATTLRQKVFRSTLDAPRRKAGKAADHRLVAGAISSMGYDYRSFPQPDDKTRYGWAPAHLFDGPGGYTADKGFFPVANRLGGMHDAAGKKVRLDSGMVLVSWQADDEYQHPKKSTVRHPFVVAGMAATGLAQAYLPYKAYAVWQDMRNQGSALAKNVTVHGKVDPEAMLEEVERLYGPEAVPGRAPNNPTTQRNREYAALPFVREKAEGLFAAARNAADMVRRRVNAWHVPGLEEDGPFRGADLANAHMEGLDLRGRNFSGADLRGANLTGANLDGALFEGALMEGAVLDGASAENTVFNGAQMEDASMQGVTAPRASFAGTVMDRADMTDADAKGAVFTDARLNGVNLRGAVLGGTGPRREGTAGTNGRGTRRREGAERARPSQGFGSPAHERASTDAFGRGHPDDEIVEAEIVEEGTTGEGTPAYGSTVVDAEIIEEDGFGAAGRTDRTAEL